MKTALPTGWKFPTQIGKKLASCVKQLVEKMGQCIKQSEKRFADKDRQTARVIRKN